LSSTTSDRGDRGQVLVLFAGALLTILIVAALAFDVGMMLVERRDQQDAADAAALAGARYVLDDVAQARTAAADIARTNGFDDADANETVTIHIPAIHGRYAGIPGFIEVDISANRSSIFGGVIGRAVWPVGVFAVATNSQDLTFPFGMLALDPTECRAIDVSGGGVVESQATIQANSSGAECTGAPYGFARTGGSTINVLADDATCRVVGELQDQGSGSMTCDKAENSFALPDPLRNLAAPAKPALAAAMTQVGHTKAPPDFCPGATGSKAPTETQIKTCDVGGNGSAYANLAWVLSPGLYPHGLTVTNGAKAYLLPGIYWIGGGGMRVSGGGTIMTVATAAGANVNPAAATWGGGVMFYNSKLPASPGDAIDLNGSGAVMKLKPLSVATTSPDAIYNGIVLFQDRTVTTSVTLNGSASTTNVEGIIYVPGAQVKLNGNGGTLVVDQIIANTFDITGNSGTIKVMHGIGVDAHIVAAGLVD
jgi:hypothetical protein